MIAACHVNIHRVAGCDDPEQLVLAAVRTYYGKPDMRQSQIEKIARYYQCIILDAAHNRWNRHQLLGWVKE